MGVDARCRMTPSGLWIDAILYAFFTTFLGGLTTLIGFRYHWAVWGFITAMFAYRAGYHTAKRWEQK